jgi:aryl-alcohol dehydrogenase-like predicted oxidoreductase
MLPLAPFGRTGHLSSRVIFGAAALASMRPERALTVLDLVTRHGVNHIDTAASYGASEDLLLPWLREHRDEVFLATKTGERTGVAARRELERSLERMGVDRVDLIQLHDLVEPDQWDVAHGPGGAVEALFAARDEGIVGAVGVTGHGLRIARMHLASLDRADFDSVLLPFNHSLLADPKYAAAVEELLAVCAERRVAVQTIKSCARRRWSEDSPGARHSWYEPITDAAAIGRAVRFVLSNDALFLNSPSDTRILEQVLDAAAGGLHRPSDDELAADAAALGIEPIFDGADLERI